jgi:hypothetical protein
MLNRTVARFLNLMRSSFLLACSFDLQPVSINLIFTFVLHSRTVSHHSRDVSWIADVALIGLPKARSLSSLVLLSCRHSFVIQACGLTELFLIKFLLLSTEDSSNW